jgi:hypothetical protein
MQKLAFAYFPIYVFLIITSETLITTLFTQKYEKAVPIFLIFLTLLPFHILISDPIVRSFENLGRFLLKVRIVTFVLLVIALYLGITYLDMRGIIAIVVGIRITEMLFVEFVVFRSIGVRFSDLRLLGDVVKTAILSISAGIVTFILYEGVRGPIATFCTQTVSLYSSNAIIAEFISGIAILGVSFSAFAIVYLSGAYLLGTIEESEKEHVRRLFRNTFSRTRS